MGPHSHQYKEPIPPDQPEQANLYFYLATLSGHALRADGIEARAWGGCPTLGKCIPPVLLLVQTSWWCRSRIGQGRCQQRRILSVSAVFLVGASISTLSPTPDARTCARCSATTVFPVPAGPRNRAGPAKRVAVSVAWLGCSHDIHDSMSPLRAASAAACTSSALTTRND